MNKKKILLQIFDWPRDGADLVVFSSRHAPIKSWKAANHSLTKVPLKLLVMGAHDVDIFFDNAKENDEFYQSLALVKGRVRCRTLPASLSLDGTIHVTNCGTNQVTSDSFNIAC